MRLPQHDVGADHVEAEQMLARGDALDHGAARRIEAAGAAPEGRRELPELRKVLLVLGHEQEGEAALLRIVGGELAAGEELRLAP